MNLIGKIEQLNQLGQITPETAMTLRHFFISYEQAVIMNGGNIAACTPILSQFLSFVTEQVQNPYAFDHFHKKMTQPFDYYHFGLDFIRPLVKLEESKVVGIESIDEIASYVAKGENVVLFANHQTEPDPQAISLLLEQTHPKLAEDMIFVAGHRVVTDPLAVPFSKGRNLLCIHSKNYIDFPPEQKRAKVSHNQTTMKRMRDLLSEGGKCIYVAPSGGRDRPNQEGKVEVASFDPQSIEMFWFIAQHADRPTHFYPLALATFNLFPPPNRVVAELGENRKAQCTPIHLAFGKEIDMEHFPDSECQDKHQKRQYRGDYIWKLVKKLYAKIR